VLPADIEDGEGVGLIVDRTLTEISAHSRPRDPQFVRLPSTFAIRHCLASFVRLAGMKLDTRSIERLSFEPE
jgi:hypothetical protein